MTRWLVCDYVYEKLPQLRTAWPPPFVLASPKAVATDVYGVEVANYKSFEQFQKDVRDNAIDPRYGWVLYDPEDWTYTPIAEQARYADVMRRFSQHAHSLGYRVITAPARDLAPPGERDLNDWYRTEHVAWDGARHADAIDIQAQAVTEDGAAAYAEFINETKRQALNANPYALILAGVSTHHGTAAQMCDAAKSVKVDGFWLNVPGPDPDFAKAAEFLKLYEG